VKEKVGRVRWGISILLSLGIVVNYFDRINISIATKPLMREFGLNLSQMGIILSAFIWAYTIAQIPAGAILDRVGVKWLNRACTLAWTRQGSARIQTNLRQNVLHGGHSCRNGQPSIFRASGAN
jgi:hypothetical protein